MINLPPKPMQKPGAPESVSAGEPPAFPPVPKPPGLPSFAPKAPPVVGLSAPPAAPKPPISGVAPPAPKPPSVAPVAPKPPSVVGIPLGVPKPGVPPLAPKPPGTVMPSAPKAPSVSSAPAPPSAESKKETAKVPPSASGPRPGLPQSSVHLQRRPGASASSSSAITVAPQTQAEGGVSLVVGILALAASLIAVGIQVWMFL
jgi:hypothetical protein